jgi:hypothetical protein
MAMLQSYDERECEGEDSQGINPMVLGQIAIFAGALVVAIAVQSNSANALSMQECSAKVDRKVRRLPCRDKPLSRMS